MAGVHFSAEVSASAILIVIIIVISVVAAIGGYLN